jgi:hypothetical protein
MNNLVKITQRRIFVSALLLLVGLIFAPGMSNAQDDRSERLQEKVKASDDRIDVLKNRSESQRINAPAFQAVRIAKKRKELALQKVAEAEREDSRARKQSSKKAATARSKALSIKKEKVEDSGRVHRARLELKAAEAELAEARERLKAQ